MNDTPDTPDILDTLDPPEPLTIALARSRQRFVTATNNTLPTEDDIERVKVLVGQVQDLGATIEYLVPECRDKELALTHLEDVLTRASRAIYVKDPIGGRRPALADTTELEG